MHKQNVISVLYIDCKCHVWKLGANDMPDVFTFCLFPIFLGKKMQPYFQRAAERPSGTAERHHTWTTRTTNLPLEYMNFKKAGGEMHTFSMVAGDLVKRLRKRKSSLNDPATGPRQPWSKPTALQIMELKKPNPNAKSLPSALRISRVSPPWTNNCPVQLGISGSKLGMRLSNKQFYLPPFVASGFLNMSHDETVGHYLWASFMFIISAHGNKK